MILHGYFRSSTSLRVRAALNFKGVSYDQKAYPLLENAQRSSAYLDLNPQGLVPALELDDGSVLTQSLAICEYIEDVWPEPPLMPEDALGRARVRSLSQIVALDVHPLNNLRVLQRLRSSCDQDDEGVAQWFRQWATTGFSALEQRLSSETATGLFCHGDQPSIADVCLFAQVINNRRFSVSLEPYPTIARIFERCEAVEAFAAAMPDRQPDAPSA